MALISLRQMLDHAAENGYGVPAFNVNNLEQMRAIMEGAAFGLRHNVEVAARAGFDAETLACVGGGARSALWNQIKADVMGLPVAVPRVREAALVGAAVIAGVGAGRLPDITEGANQMVRIDEVLEPNPDHHQRYTELFAVYRRLYPDLRDAFHQLGQVT